MTHDDFLWNHYFEEPNEPDDYYEQDHLREQYYKQKDSYQDEDKRHTT